MIKSRIVVTYSFSKDYLNETSRRINIRVRNYDVNGSVIAPS